MKDRHRNWRKDLSNKHEYRVHISSLAFKQLEQRPSLAVALLVLEGDGVWVRVLVARVVAVAPLLAPLLLESVEVEAARRGWTRSTSWSWRRWLSNALQQRPSLAVALLVLERDGVWVRVLVSGVVAVAPFLAPFLLESVEVEAARRGWTRSTSWCRRCWLIVALEQLNKRSRLAVALLVLEGDGVWVRVLVSRVVAVAPF